MNHTNIRKRPRDGGDEEEVSRSLLSPFPVRPKKTPRSEPGEVAENKTDTGTDIQAIVPPGYDPVYPYGPTTSPGGVPMPMPAFYNNNDFQESPITALALRLRDPMESTPTGLTVKLGQGIYLDSSGALSTGTVESGLSATSPLMYNLSTKTLSLNYEQRGLIVRQNALALWLASPLGFNISGQLTVLTGDGLTATNSLQVNLAEIAPIYIVQGYRVGLRYRGGLERDTAGFLAVKPGNGLDVSDINGVSVKAASPLSFDSSGRLSLTSGQGLQVVNGSLQVQTDSSIKTETDGSLSVNCTATAPLGVQNGSQFNLNYGNGLNVVGGSLAVNLGNGLAFNSLGGIEISGGVQTLTGVAPIVVSDNRSISLTTGNGLKVENGRLVVNNAPGLTFVSGGQLGINLGPGTTLDGQSRLTWRTTSPLAIAGDGQSLTCLVTNSDTLKVVNGAIASPQWFIWSGTRSTDNVDVGSGQRITVYLALSKVGKLVQGVVFTKTPVNRTQVVLTMRFTSNGRLDNTAGNYVGQFGWQSGADGNEASYDNNPLNLDPTKMLPSRSIYLNSGNGNPHIFKTNVYNTYPRYNGVQGTLEIYFNYDTDNNHPYALRFVWTQQYLNPAQWCSVTFSYFTD